MTDVHPLVTLDDYVSRMRAIGLYDQPLIALTRQEMVDRLKTHFSRTDILRLVDLLIDKAKEYVRIPADVAGTIRVQTYYKMPKEAYEKGGAVRLAIEWLLTVHRQPEAWPGPDSLLCWVDRLMQEYGFVDNTVSPRCALRRALVARINLAAADAQLAASMGMSTLKQVRWDASGERLPLADIQAILDGAARSIKDPEQVYELSSEYLDSLFKGLD